MEKRKSYQELLKEYTMTQKKNDTKEMEWYVNFVLNDQLIQRRIKELRTAIDRSLDERDEATFQRLAKELKNLVGH